MLDHRASAAGGQGALRPAERLPLSRVPHIWSTLLAHRSSFSTSNIYTQKNSINLRFYTIILHCIEMPYIEDDVREALEAVANGQSIRKASLA